MGRINPYLAVAVATAAVTATLVALRASLGLATEALAYLLIVFLSAALLEVAAGIAGGCTSGLAISGGIVAAPAAFLFIASMFGTGILTAWLVYGKRF